jgi:N-acetyl-anhydromuramyl-L-alanine amidase AmpD
MAVVLPRDSFARQDIYHTVAPGETLWRLGKMYDVPIEDIIRSNRMSKRSDLVMGQRLFIPDAAPLRPVVPLYPSKKWKYIVIHHSATDVGNALEFYKWHKKRGWRGLGYHFVIDNGSHDKQDGQIEVSPRWLHQENGAHCKAGGMNRKGIGICLVGNFSVGDITDNQMDSLVYLVSILQEYYDIPDKNIMGHGQVPGARTECPGKYFPWKDFWKTLEERR